MARYGKEHKVATRRRIVDAAGRRLKQDGIDGSGVATLMADAGLTNGAFYAHFSSKEDLVANTIAAQLDAQRDRYADLVRDRDGVEQLVREYLSPEHRDHPSEGCPAAALLDEIGRCAEPVRRAYTEGTLAIVDDLAGHLAPEDPASARGAVLGVFAMMFGTLQVARALTDPELADEVLERGVQNALTLLGGVGS